jgi:hypothetical protein
MDNGANCILEMGKHGNIVRSELGQHFRMNIILKKSVRKMRAIHGFQSGGRDGSF